METGRRRPPDWVVLTLFLSLTIAIVVLCYLLWSGCLIRVEND